jgi:hypothetical protein
MHKLIGNTHKLIAMLGIGSVVLAGCGSGSRAASSPTPATTGGPASVAEAYFHALGKREAGKVCALLTTQKRNQMMIRSLGAVSSCEEAESRFEQRFRAAFLNSLATARAKVLSQSGNKATVQRVGGTVKLTLIRSGPTWLVS